MTPSLKSVLDAAYADYHQGKYRDQDPVRFVHDYSDPGDQEIAGFLSALLAYGNVKAIQSSVGRLLGALGPSPRLAVTEGKLSSHGPFRHRWTSDDDLRIVGYWLRHCLTEHGSIDAFFAWAAPQGDMKERLSRFVRALWDIRLPRSLQPSLVARQRTLRYLVPSPERGSACKRLNLFLRWMVRPSDGIDFGIWKSVRPSELVLPVDVHLLRTLRRLRWTRSRAATWEVAERATQNLRLFCPEDPVRYDFSLCHLGMRGGDIRHYKEDPRVSMAP